VTKKKIDAPKAAHVGSFSYKLDWLLLTPHSFSVTLVTLGFRLFFTLLQINHPQSTFFFFGRQPRKLSPKDDEER
jgi:hypothetical protein